MTTPAKRAADGLRSMYWTHREGRTELHTREHLSPHCPLCHPLNDTHAERIARVVLNYALNIDVLADFIATHRETVTEDNRLPACTCGAMWLRSDWTTESANAWHAQHVARKLRDHMLREAD